jgi:FixJ family two-component response regulator
MTPAATPTVFVVDDDDLVRAAIQGMLKSVGLRSETFGTAQEFAHEAAGRAKLPCSRRETSRSQRSGFSARVG